MFENIPEVSPGDDILAEHYNKLVQRANREIDGQDFVEDELGTLLMDIPGGGDTISAEAYFARLTEDLLCNQTAEARLFKSTDPPDTDPALSAETITVYDKFLPSGKLAANTDVWVLYFAPYQRWYVLGLSCM